MKFFILAALLAVACAQKQAPGPTEADQPRHSQVQAPHSQVQAAHSQVQAAGPNEADTNNDNAKRQHKVNYNALHYGGGVGTAPYYGVPGTDVKGVHNDGRYYGHGFGHHGAYNNGYNTHHNNGYNAHHGGYHGGHISGHHGGYYQHGY